MKVIRNYRSKQVAEIVFNRPEKRNAVDFDVIKQLNEHLANLEKNKEITVLILRGEGEVFCSGGDLQAFHSLKTKAEALTMLKPMSEVLKRIVSFPAVTVAFLNGTAVGGGAEIASATDYRFAKDKGVVGFIQGNLHITTGWGGASLLKRRIGKEKALEMLGTSARYKMTDLVTLGFVYSIVSDIREIDEWCQQWKNPRIIETYKQLLFTKQEKQHLFLSMDEEVEASASLWESEEHHQAVQGFLEKR